MNGERKKQRRREMVLRWTRRVAITLGLLTTLIVVAGFASLMIWPPINVVETGATPEYPDIRPRAYAFSQDRVLGAATEVVDGEVETFSLVDVDEGSGTVQGEAVSRTGWFVDDLTVRVEANGAGGAIVFVRSASRLGMGDFGQNANNIRIFFDALERNLGLR